MNKLFTLLCFMSFSAQASQIQVMDEEQEIHAVMSTSELNRVLVERDRISDVFTHSSSLEILPDERLGQIFIRINQPPKEGIRLTLTTEDGRIQDLRLQGQHISGQTLILKERPEAHAEPKHHDERNEIIHILSEFHLGRIPEHFSIVEECEGFQIFQSNSHNVESFTYTNASDVPVALEESPFVDSAEAVLIDCLYLDPGESTKIWRVLSHD